MKKLLIIGLCLSLIIVFIIAGEEKVAPTAAQKIYIPVISNGLQNQFWQAVRVGAEKAARDYGIETTFEGPETDKDVEQQLDILKSTLVRNPQAIVLTALDSKAATSYLEEAQKSGVPIVSFNSGVDSPIVTTTVGTDNYGAGTLAADKMAELIGKEGKVGLIIHNIRSKAGIDRRDGFIDTIQQKYPNIKIIPTEYGEGKEAAEATKSIIAANPDIKGIFGGNEGAIEGVINAVKEVNKVGEITLIGFDSGKELLTAIREGTVAGAVTQDPIDMGYKALETAFKAYKGDILPAFIETKFEWYDKSNIDSPEIKKLLYE